MARIFTDEAKVMSQSKKCAICGIEFTCSTTATVCGADCRKVLKDQIKRRWYENHKPLTILRAKNWKAANPERFKVSARKRYQKNLLANREYSRTNARKYRLLSPERYRQANVRNWAKHRDQYMQLVRANTARYINEMSDNYIRSKLELPKAICPPELIAAKRAHLQLKRLLKQNKTEKQTTT